MRTSKAWLPKMRFVSTLRPFFNAIFRGRNCRGIDLRLGYSSPKWYSRTSGVSKSAMIMGPLV